MLQTCPSLTKLLPICKLNLTLRHRRGGVFSLQIFRLFQVKRQQHRRRRAWQQTPKLQGGDDALKEYFSEKKEDKERDKKQVQSLN